jgi:hypothetical protein
MVKKRLMSSTADLSASKRHLASKETAAAAGEKGEKYSSQARAPEGLREDSLIEAPESSNTPAKQVALPDTTGPPEPLLSEDLLVGAGEISKFVYGTSRRRRAIYHLFEQNALPGFRWGGQLCARKSKLMEFIRERENATLSVLADAAE